MSEDTTGLKISLSEKAGKFDEISTIIRRYAKEHDCTDVDISTSDSGISAFLEFVSFGSSVLRKLIREIQRKGASKVVCTTYADNVGEQMFSSIIKGEYVEFQSLEELEDYEKESDKPLDLHKFDYGKDRGNRTAIVRLQIKAKRKRARVSEFFQNAINLKENGFDEFCAKFLEIISCDTHDIEWCRFKWKERFPQWFEGPKNLIHGLKFVVTHKNLVFLGFDVEGLDLHEGRHQDSDIENLIFVLSNIDGVTKTWIKIRPGANTVKELYIFHPGMGDEPMVLRRPLTTDSEWPR